METFAFWNISQHIFLPSFSFNGFIHNSLSLFQVSFLSLFPDVMSRSINQRGLNDWVGLSHPVPPPLSCNSVRLLQRRNLVSSVGFALLCVLRWISVVDFAFFFVVWMKSHGSDSSLVFLCVTHSLYISVWANAPICLQTWKLRHPSHCSPWFKFPNLISAKVSHSFRTLIDATEKKETELKDKKEQEAVFG